MHNSEYIEENKPFSELQPFKLSPVYLEKIWGGQALKSILDKDIPSTSKIGESWEISAEEPYQTKISQGKFKGHKLGDICKMYSTHLLGNSNDITDFPLLFKFIDANDKLSIQVHPDDLQAIEHKWGVRGKTECWYVVEAPKDGTIIVGLNKSISKEEMFEAIEKGNFKNLLKEEKIYPDDLLLIPAGTIHSIMSNTLIYEVQESSDVTLRIYDWDRYDKNGKQRPLQIEDALNVTDTNHYGSFKISPVTLNYENYSHSYRVACRYFAIEQYSIYKNVIIKLEPKKSFSALTIISGSVTLTNINVSIELKKGESAIIPACCVDSSISASSDSKFLITTVPDLRKEVINPLKKQGIPIASIIQLGGVIPEKNDLLTLVR